VSGVAVGGVDDQSNLAQQHPQQASVPGEEVRAAPARSKTKAPQVKGETQEQNLAKHMETMRLKEVSSQGINPPEKRKLGQFPGKEGRICKLSVNHFPLKPPPKVIYAYTITIEPPWKRPYLKRDNEIYRKVFHKWSKICPETKKMMNPKWDYHYSLAFNGNNIFYATKSINGNKRIEDIEDIEVTEDNKALRFHVRNVKEVSVIKVAEEMQRFMEKGRSAFPHSQEAGHPQDSLNALDVILQQGIKLNNMYRTVGRSYFHQDGEVLDVGFGKEVWIGTFTSIRPFGWKNAGYMMTMNADVSNKPATKNLHLTEDQKGKVSYIKSLFPRARNLDFKKGLQWKELEELDRDLKNLKVRYELPNGNKRAYKVNKVMDSASKLIIPDLKISVAEYFKKEHGQKLKYPNMPCLHLGSISKTIYIPVEFCRMESQPLPRGKKLADDAVAAMIKGTATKPDIRKNKILEGLRINNETYKNDKFAQQFGISFQDSMAKINGRVLAPPAIGYNNHKKDKGMIINIDQRSPGSWRPTPNKHRYVDGKELTTFAVLDLVQMNDGQYAELLHAFAKVGSQVGLKITTDENNMWHQRSREDTFQADFEHIVEEYKNANLNLQMIMVILPFKGGIFYDSIKNLGDIKHKIPTQCVLQRTLYKQGQLNMQVISNLCLKMNAKLGGVNHVLADVSRPNILKRPIMVMGADVTHAAPESKGEKPSIAAIVGSMDPAASKYECEVRIQSREHNEEIIQDFKEVTKSLLMKFYNINNKRKPEQIIMFRDGVSEGQFGKVLAFELLAMREACKALDPEYEPCITYLVVQKRHHTRFFAEDGNKYFKNGNVLAGTVVDQGINHPTEGDFYLVSHEGIQGTSRPTHYQVLWDDKDLTADELEKLTYYLCHLYSRCTRSVSYPSPTYYSHLAADRARRHHNDMLAKRVRDSEIKRQLEAGDVKLMYFV